MSIIKCSSCGGDVVDGKQKYHHLKRCQEYTKEGIDHLVCKECGYRSPMLTQHIKIHGMTVGDYRIKFPNAPVQLVSAIVKRNRSNIGTHVIPIKDRAGAILCDRCGEWYLKRYSAKHLEECVATNPDKYEEGVDYVKCPECGKAMSRLGSHLKKEHGWDKDRIAVEQGRGLKLIASSISDKMSASIDFEAAQRKREATNLERHGHANPFSNPEFQEKIKETSDRRYGASHAMKTEEVRCRQERSSQRGMSGQEALFDGYTCDNVVYSGYGGRYIRTKTGVMKYGRLIKDLNPDFVILPDCVLDEARTASDNIEPMDRQKCRTRYVVELLGDWYHSEGVIGIKPEEHERQIIEAYASVGIECLVLWEHDITGRWEVIRPMVDAWLERAVRDINERPVYGKARV